MRLAMLASLMGHAAAIAALAAFDWRAPDFAPSIPVALVVPPALQDQAMSPTVSTSTDVAPPPAAPAAAAGTPGIELSAALTEPVAPPRPAPAAPTPKPLRQAAKPAPATPATTPVETRGEATGAVEVPEAAPAPTTSGRGLASATPATAPVVEFGPAPMAGNPRPEYPPAARRRSIEGRAVVRAVVAADGRVASVELRTSSSHDMLDRAALEAVKRWRFTPAKRGDQSVDGAVDVPVVFRLEE